MVKLQRSWGGIMDAVLLAEDANDACVAEILLPGPWQPVLHKGRFMVASKDGSYWPKVV